MRAVFFMVLLSASCSMDQSGRSKHGDCCEDFVAQRQTRVQGVAAAKRDIREKGFRIIRYDLPWVRTGAWEQYLRNFRHFGIDESNEMSASMDYCRAYNGEMDRQLLLRYGDEYRRLRSQILPKPGAPRVDAAGHPV